MAGAITPSRTLALAAVLVVACDGDRGATADAASLDAGEGLDADGARDARPFDPRLDAPPQCSSMSTWTEGNRSSARMNPGRPCIDCHGETDFAPFFVAGTVYETAHEPDDCFGVRSTEEDPVLVEITDATGAVLVLRANTAGNFYHREPIALPFTAAVRRGDRVRRMMASQTSGDCNACHTQLGVNDAPGRIVLP